MAKKKGSIVYKCSNCSYTQPGWLGRCPNCGEWNSMQECIVDPNAAIPSWAVDGTAVKVKPVPMAKISVQDEGRISTGSAEFDRVLGGGAVRRSAILIGGEPGIGKSTLLSMMARNTDADINVIALVGERGREAPDFLKRDLGEEGLKRLPFHLEEPIFVLPQTGVDGGGIAVVQPLPQQTAAQHHTTSL